MIQISLLLFSYLVANIIPFFSSLQGIIGSALAAPIMFGWPPLFFLCCVRMKNHKLERSDLILCTSYLLCHSSSQMRTIIRTNQTHTGTLFLFVLLPFCTIVGTCVCVFMYQISAGERTYSTKIKHQIIGTVAAFKSMIDQWNEE